MKYVCYDQIDVVLVHKGKKKKRTKYNLAMKA